MAGPIDTEVESNAMNQSKHSTASFRLGGGNRTAIRKPSRQGTVPLESSVEESKSGSLETHSIGPVNSLMLVPGFADQRADCAELDSRKKGKIFTEFVSAPPPAPRPASC